MTDYISREAAIASIAHEDASFVYAIERIPVADVRRVVRCWDCKHATPWYRDKLICNLWSEHGIDVFEDGFCNYGKERGEEDA